MPSVDELLRRQKALGDFGDFVLDNDDLQAVLDEGCRLVAEALDADLAKVLEIDEASHTALVRAGFGWKPGIVGRERVSLGEQSSEAFAVEQAMPVITNDIAHETRFHFPPFLRDHGVVALVNVPIFVPSRKPWGVLQVDAREPRAFEQEDVDFLRTYAMVLGPVIDRLQKVAGLRRTEEKSRALFDSIDEGMAIQELIYDEQGEVADVIFRDVNAAYERHGGVRDVIGRSIFDVLPGVESYWLDHYRRVARTGRPIRVEDYQGHVDRWFDVYFSRVDQDGRFVAIVFADISERKRAEAALRKSEERQAFLLRLSDALRPVGDPVEIQRTATRLLGEQLRASRVFYVLVEPDEDTATIFANYTDGVPDRVGRYSLSAFSSWAAGEWRAGRTASTDDVNADPRWSETERAAYASVSTRAGFGAPLIKEGRLVALLGVNQSAPRRWTEEERELAREVAERTWAAVERARAEAALRESEERQRLMVELVPALLWSVSPDGLSVSLNERWLAYTGQSEADTQNYGWLDAIHPEDLPATRATFQRAFATGEPIERQQRILKAGDGSRWHLVRHVPVRDTHGAITRWFGVAVDIHNGKLAEQARDESERRLRTLMEGIPQLVWRSCDLGMWTWASPQWCDFTGQRQAESLGLGWLDAVHPEDREATLRAWEQAKPHGLLDVEYRVRRAADGRWIWHHTRSVPVRDADGQIVEWLGTSTDMQQLKELQQRQAVLVAELQHRVRNILTIVRSVFTRTAEDKSELEQVASHFRGRLDALARTQVIVTGTAERRVDLESLIRDELLSVGVSDGPNLRLAGPMVSLPHKQAESLGLAVHELTTNAVKYGALKTPHGKLEITWKTNPGDRSGQQLDFTWEEQGVPAVSLNPSRDGFGRELIEEALPYRLGAKTELEFRPGGVRCRIAISLDDEEAAMRPYEVR